MYTRNIYHHIANPCHLWHLPSWKILGTVKLGYPKLRPYAKSGVGETDMWNMIICRQVFTGTTMVFLAEICQGDQMWSAWRSNVECMAKRENKDFVKKVVILNWFVFCMFLYTSLPGAMTASIPFLSFRYLSIKWLIPKKWSTKLSAICRPFFRALLVSYDLSTMASESSSSSSLRFKVLLS